MFFFVPSRILSRDQINEIVSCLVSSLDLLSRSRLVTFVSLPALEEIDLKSDDTFGKHMHGQINVHKVSLDEKLQVLTFLLLLTGRLDADPAVGGNKW